MDGHQWESSARNSNRYFPRQHSQDASPRMSAFARLESTGRGGARAMLFSNPMSPSWPGTAISTPQEYENQSYEPRSSLHVGLPSPTAHVPNSTYMNDDNRTVDPRCLILHQPDAQILHESRFEPGNANLSASGTPYSGPYESTLRSPLSYAYEGPTFPGPSPTALTTPSSAGTSYSQRMIGQEALYSPMNTRNEAMRNEEYQAYLSRTMAQSPLEANFPYMTSSVVFPHWSAAGQEIIAGGHGAPYYTEHPREQVRTWNDVYDEEFAMLAGPSGQPAHTPHRLYQNAQTPIAPGSSLTTRAVPEWIKTDVSFQTGSSSPIRPRPSRRGRSIRPRTLTSTWVSTGEGFETHMYNHELVPSQRSPIAQSGADASGSSMSPDFEFPAASPVERVRRADKGKRKEKEKGGERLILHEEKEDRDGQPTNEPSPSTSGNLGRSRISHSPPLKLQNKFISESPSAKDALKLHTRKMKTPALRRAQPIRPREILCPLADCGQPITNTFGAIQQHVDTCCSSSVRAVQESQSQRRRTDQAQAQALAQASASASRPRETETETPATRKITCPTCPRRTYASLRRWADHLREMHGEWNTYRCEVAGCGDVFLCVKDRDQHMRVEH